MPASPDDYFVCPHCGRELPGDADFCPACGASDDSGWNDASDEYDDDFDYEEFVEREFPQHREGSPSRTKAQYMAAAIIALIILSLVATMLF